MNDEVTSILEHLKESVQKDLYFEIPPREAKVLLDAIVFSTVHNGNLACALAHRACGSAEHDPQNGKIHGYCVVCLLPWPCETAQHFIREAKVKS